MSTSNDDKTAIRLCIQRCAEASNGHGRRWARERLMQQLGSAPDAQSVAAAADAVGRAIQACANRQVGCSAVAMPHIVRRAAASRTP